MDDEPMANNDYPFHWLHPNAAARRVAQGLIDRSFCRTSFTALISANATRQYGALLKQWGSL